MSDSRMPTLMKYKKCTHSAELIIIIIIISYSDERKYHCSISCDT